MAVHLPVGIIGYTCLQDGVKDRKKLFAYGYDNIHLSLTLLDSLLEIDTVERNRPDRGYGKHPDDPSYISVASMTHLRMFRLVTSRLKALRTPSKMGEELLQGREAINILYLRDDCCQRSGIPNREIARVIRKIFKEILYLPFYPLYVPIKGYDPPSQYGS